MHRFLSSTLLFLLSCPAVAAVGDEGVASAPGETVSIVYVIIFGVIFVAMIAGFFVYLWWNEQKKPENKS